MAWRACTLALFAASGCLTAGPALTPYTLPQTQFPTDTQVRWYDVTGATPLELRGQLDLRGPEDGDGRHHDAYTAWYVTWRFPFAQTDEGCSTGPVRTVLKVNVTFPRWQAAPGADPELVAAWQRYLEALFEHESGHRHSGLRAAYELADLLQSLEPKPSCPEAEAVANEAAQRVLEKYRAVDLAYDLETRHGETQGAVFP